MQTATVCRKGEATPFVGTHALRGASTFRDVNRDRLGLPFAGFNPNWTRRRAFKIGEIRDHELHEAQRVALRRGALSGAYVITRVSTKKTRVYTSERLGLDLSKWPSATQARVVGVVALVFAFGRSALACTYKGLAELMNTTEGTARNAVRSAVRLGYLRKVPMFERDRYDADKLWQTCNLYEPGPELRAAWESFQLKRAIWRVRQLSAAANRSRRASAAARRRWEPVNSRQKLYFASSKQTKDKHARANESACGQLLFSPSGLTQDTLGRLGRVERARAWYEKRTWDPSRGEWSKRFRANDGGGRRKAPNTAPKRTGPRRSDFQASDPPQARPIPGTAQGEAMGAHFLGQFLAMLGAPPVEPETLRRDFRRARGRLEWRNSYGRVVLPEDP